MLHALNHVKHLSLTQKNIRHESYLSRLNSECISKINKVDINQSTKSTLEKINHKYRQTIYDEVKNQYDVLHAHKLFYPDDTLESRELAKGYQIACGLFSTQEFLKNYSVTIPGMSLEAAIHPHLRGKWRRQDRGREGVPPVFGRSLERCSPWPCRKRFGRSCKVC